MVVCPNCGRDAPVIYRGALPYCTACGKIRAPLTGPAVHLTGRPSKLGGEVTRIFGWLAMVIGTTFALAIGAFFQWIFPAAIIGWVLGIGLLVLTLMVAFGLLKGGSLLRDSGKRAEARTVEQAIFALAEARGGVLSTLDVAQVLSISDSEADAQLTDFAKRYPERVRVELDPNGTLVYEFPQYMLATANTVAVPSMDYVTLEEQDAAATRGAPSKQRR